MDSETRLTRLGTMPGSIERLSWVARWKLAALVNRNRYRAYPLFGNTIHLNVNESLMTWQCARGEYDARKRELLHATLAPGMCFVDVGANLGYFTLFAASRVGQGGKVLAIEPGPDNVHWLKVSVDSSKLRQVQVIPEASSDVSGEALLHLGRKSGWHTLNAGLDNRRQGAVKITRHTLDGLLESRARVDCIKIDVEGHEDRVLRGARETLRRHRPLILLDLHPQLGADLDAIDHLLRGLGYRCFAMDRPDKPLEGLPDFPAELLLKAQ